MHAVPPDRARQDGLDGVGDKAHPHALGMRGRGEDAGFKIRRVYGASGSTRMMVSPCWSPSQRLERAPDFCTSTWRTLVSCGNRYSVNSPVWVFSRTATSLSIPAVQTYVLSSNCAS